MRKTLDQLISWTGLILAVVLLAAGGLLMYASNFVHQNVESQLSQQRITMPAADPPDEPPVIRVGSCGLRDGPS